MTEHPAPRGRGAPEAPVVLPGLPAFGPEPVFRADDAMFGVLVARAASRRRRRLAALAAAVAVAFAMAVFGGPGVGDEVGLEPTGEDPTPSAGATAPGETPTAAPPTGPAGPAATATGTPRGGPAAAPSGDPAGSPAGPPASPTSSPTEPRTHVDPPPPEWREKWIPVTDNGGNCAPQQTNSTGWCFRYLGPVETWPGKPVTFTSELCRTGVTEGRVDFERAADLAYTIARPDGPDEDLVDDPVARSEVGLPAEAHSRAVAFGTCLRWTTTWNGLGDDRKPLPRGTYTLRVITLGSTPGEQPPPINGTGARHGDYLYFPVR